jgi:predicted methyltransferase
MMRRLLAATGALALAACVAAPMAETVDGPAEAGTAETLAAPAPARTTTARRSAGDPVAQALAARDRPADQAEQDENRRAADVLAFSGIEPGDRVLDLGAVTGYSTWLLSGLVGPEGAVVAQNPTPWVDNYDIITPAMEALTVARANTSHTVMAFDRLEGEPASFDAVFSGLVYHDTAYMDVDRGVMNRRVYELLKPGGVYLIVDHHAATGSGVRDVQTIHRIDAAQVRREVESVGFILDGELDVLTRPEDDLTLNVFDEAIRGRTSQFVYRFVKPEM